MHFDRFIVNERIATRSKNNFEKKNFCAKTQ